MNSCDGEQISSDRLELARRRRGITKRALSKSLGMTERTVSSYFSGAQDPKRKTLEKLSEILDFPVEFFFGDPLAEARRESPSFRAMSKMTARQRDQTVAAGTLGMYLSDWIERKFRLPESDIPQYDSGIVTPEAAATEIRIRWGLGERPIKNMLHLLEYHGVRVFALSEDTRNIDAHSFWHGEKPFVFLDTRKSAERSRMDAAHELGHLVLHFSESTQRNPQAEREAQEFASTLLMPAGSVLARIRPGSTLAEIIKAKHHWNVSVSSLTYRLHTLGLLTKYQFTSLFIEIGKLGYRTNEPEPSSRERSQVLNKVFGRLLEKGITVGRVARELSIPSEEVGKLLWGLADFPIILNGQQSAVESNPSFRQPSSNPPLRLVT